MINFLFKSDIKCNLQKLGIHLKGKKEKINI